MKRDKETSSFVNISSSSLLIIFLILCLTTFAILSLSSAKSDYTFSQRLAQHKAEYYEASAEAETVLAEIDNALASGIPASDIPENVNGILIETDGHQISYKVPMSEKQAIHVVLRLTDPAKHKNYYEIERDFRDGN